MDWQTKDSEKLESLPKRERMLPPIDARERGKNFPFKRFQNWLDSQVGQHIDKVFSRFTKLAWIEDRYRTREELRGYIELDTFVQDGKICFYDRYAFNYGEGAPWRVVAEENGTTYYVHPKSRCLCRHKKDRPDYSAQSYRFKLAQRLRIIGDYHQYYKQEGVWYEVKAEPITDPSFIPWPHRDFRKGPRDVLLEPNNSWERRTSTSPYVKITLKKQVGHDDMMKHGLVNDPPSAEQLSKPCPKCGGIGNDCRHNQMRRISGIYALWP